MAETLYAGFLRSKWSGACLGHRGDDVGVRLARGYTNGTKIMKFEGCYHGHADSLLVKRARAR